MIEHMIERRVAQGPNFEVFSHHENPGALATQWVMKIDIPSKPNQPGTRQTYTVDNLEMIVKAMIMFEREGSIEFV